MLTQTKVLVGSTAVLYAKYLVTLSIQGSKRFAAGTRPPEDKIFKSLNPTQATQTFGLQPAASTAAAEADVRWQRIVRNDLENIPLGLLVAWAAVNSGGNELVNSVAIGTFTGARLFHTYAYANGLQPHRGYAWTLGVLSVSVLALNSIYGIVVDETPPSPPSKISK
ncbi:unnamed protein product [Aphanomyces euteiches]|uniref:Microsomal glutathione S-transferase 1 n=1 Tax=Aphanomyces euteiches TaxID=100861 RepID=A0A6G0X0F8_9STRA|nr:hypothetical protein Ae201684_009809 [Aphanomyces euteiches]KAH9095891.1 hypothetical protein Ae201684P_010101 [Aphanomyces euteiches]KAH9106683.1 hypothetical protein AeMF1_017742 [Aphanomyces euteiches]KAH9109769.1 hypothetical protein LEN26_013974 [Aphanomyces euteiches]KAH9154625.1 hypothetical protein AeRB84_003294 [Aphanomyces euteiches]